MIITLQDDMNHLRKLLEERGYDVHFLSEGYISDVYIYSERSSGLSDVYDSILPPTSGCFIINGDRKSIDEIIYSIENRVYSSLF